MLRDRMVAGVAVSNVTAELSAINGLLPMYVHLYPSRISDFQQRPPFAYQKDPPFHLARFFVYSPSTDGYGSPVSSGCRRASITWRPCPTPAPTTATEAVSHLSFPIPTCVFVFASPRGDARPLDCVNKPVAGRCWYRGPVDHHHRCAFRRVPIQRDRGRPTMHTGPPHHPPSPPQSIQPGYRTTRI